MRIWKWTLLATEKQTVSIPKFAKILTVQVKKGDPQLWALVDERNPSEFREIAIYGTGKPIPNDPGHYIATFQIHDGELVFHVFEPRN